MNDGIGKKGTGFIISFNLLFLKMNGRLILFTLMLVVLATVCKYFFGPELAWSGFSPVIAIAMFSGMIIRNRNFSFLLPLLALFISDALIELLYRSDLFPYAGFYEGQWKNYLILLSATLLGWALRGKNYSTLLAGAIAGPTVFFLISNFSVWMAGHGTYSNDFSGLMASYVAGLPFYKNALIATLIFLPSIIVAYNYITVQKAKPVLAA